MVSFLDPPAFKVPEQTNQRLHPFPSWRWCGVAAPPRFSVNTCYPFGFSAPRIPAPTGVWPRRSAPPCPFAESVINLPRNANPSIRVSTPRTSRFNIKRRRRTNNADRNPALNPNDPLNLRDLISESDRRRNEGLSPLRGDSRINTPAPGFNNEVGVDVVGIATNTSVAREVSTARDKPGLNFRLHNFRRNRRKAKRLPVTGNYSDYYCRRNPEDRIQILMPEWFSNCDVADYGCHNGTLTFRILEKFPDINKIDAFDCDPELVANAKNMQREKIRWVSQTTVRYDKINFQPADWSESNSTEDEPTYDTVLAFSVTKWIHLNCGDAGLMRFFRRIFNLLKPGGRLLLEPQPKSSYRRTRFTVYCFFHFIFRFRNSNRKTSRKCQ